MRTDGLRRFPEWLRVLVTASTEFSLQYDTRLFPEKLMEAWTRPLGPGASNQAVIYSQLQTCKPIAAHHFLYWAFCEKAVPYNQLTPMFDIVIRRPDCDRSTALNYFAYYWLHYSNGRDEWIGDAQHALMSYIRTRAWAEGFRHRRFDVPENVLHQRDGMRNCLVNNTAHPFTMPAGFFALGAKEELYFKIRARLFPRKTHLN
jgi:hypothetical protein